MHAYQKRTSMTRPSHLDSYNYGYWKVHMQAFISDLYDDYWSSIVSWWESYGDD